MILPKIIGTSNFNQFKNIDIILSIPKEIIFFEGHFPNHPVLAGVVQVDWVIFFAKKYLLSNDINIVSIDQLKFTHVILPENQVALYILIEDQKIIFKYYKDTMSFSSGKIMYK